MNDTNQATVLTDALENRAAQVHPEIQRLFQGLWQLERRGLLERLARRDAALASAAERLSDSAQDADEFGSYSPRDHLDILKDDAAEEYGAAPGLEHVSRSIRLSLDHVTNRLRPLVRDGGAWRLQPPHVTALGRALHTVADFFAHTNYVELLLWQLARDGKLADCLRAFNAPKDGLFERARVDYVCPLPLDDRGIPATNGILWYGPSPAETPLVSTVFDGRDTAYALVRMYAAHLESTEASALAGQELNLVFAVLDLPARALTEAAWRLYAGFRDRLEEVSVKVRGWLAQYLLREARRGGASGTALEAASSIVRGYDSAEAAQWARAGRFRYVASVLEHDISHLLDAQRPGEARLPHHTLLSKDHPPELPDDWARYGLACLLATDVTTELLVAYFEGASLARWDAVRAAWLRHPAEQLRSAAPPFELGPLCGVVRGAFSSHWRELAAPVLARLP